jgi:hypothetical protein
MDVSRSGYYKWRGRDDSHKELTRAKVIALVDEVHKAHPSHGYRWVCHYIRINYGLKYSENYIYKAFCFLEIHAETRHRAKRKKHKQQEKYPNLIFSTWETVDRPRQVIVSDMTSFYVCSTYHELTMYFDVFTKEILTWKLTTKRGDRNQYIDGLKEVIALLGDLKGKQPTIIHTDQGSVYTSKDYNDLIKDKNIERSMSRAGKPTDNPVNESLNGWIKEELFIDFNISGSSNIAETIERYTHYFNTERPCYSIGYETPVRYYERYINGELEKKDTFKNRVLTETPKFVQKRKADVAKKSISGYFFH